MQIEAVKDKTVVVAPLDWGMGHVTRCVPLIRQFLEQKCRVIFAGTAFQSSFIQKDFPGLICENIEGYNVSLDPSKSTYFQMLQQGLKLRKVIRREQAVAREIQKKYQAEVILSDNRYGFRSDKACNIFLTHQLSPPVPFMRAQLTNRLKKYVDQFDCCWIPDSIEHPIVSELNDVKLKIPITKIGWLCRFRKMNSPNYKYEVLFISSGPLPQRHEFERQILYQLNDANAAFVCPDDEVIKTAHINPSTEDLNQLINDSKWVVSRSGYTTVMEMISLQKKAYLMPTPGQYEQEWLAQHIKSEFIFNGKIEQLKEIFSSKTN